MSSIFISSFLNKSEFTKDLTNYLMFLYVDARHVLFVYKAKVMLLKKNVCGGDFPGGPVAKTPCSQCRGPGFDPRPRS